MRPFVSLVSGTQVPALWRALRIKLVDLIEAAPIGIFSGSSAGLQVELRASPVCRLGLLTKACAASRAHLSWRFRGVIKQALAILELHSLRPGDCAIFTPVPVKNDPFAIFFGNHPIWLPFDASDPYNAAFWLADLELAFPVAVADRRSVPPFPGR